MSAPSFAALRAAYAAAWRDMAVDAARLPLVTSIARRLIGSKARYQKVAAATGVPWFFIACLHEREASGNFNCHLHNGDPLTARTRHVPAGRPLKGAPPFSWEESAIDALAMRGFTHPNSSPQAGEGGQGDWSVERFAYEAEGYNGWGYHFKGVPSAYLWSFSNQYRGGKYIADGVWSATAFDKQCGVMPILKSMMALDASVIFTLPLVGRVGGEAAGVGVQTDVRGQMSEDDPSSVICRPSSESPPPLTPPQVIDPSRAQSATDRKDLGDGNPASVPAPAAQPWWLQLITAVVNALFGWKGRP